jgi:hypothetical protein
MVDPIIADAIFGGKRRFVLFLSLRALKAAVQGAPVDDTTLKGGADKPARGAQRLAPFRRY